MSTNTSLSPYGYLPASAAGEDTTRPSFLSISPALRVIFYATLGLTIGILIELVVSSANGTTYLAGDPDFLNQFSNHNLAVLIERLVFALLGVVMGLSSELFNRDSWSLGRATAVHALVVTSSLTLAAITLKWIPLGWAIFGFILLVLGVFAVIWLVIWFSIARQVARINAAHQASQGS
ncbi:MAG: DUF3021 domain-containing protein [Actinomycetaceae bacterium]|nr:DUF3021 domain-containing protein [Actinomycetaceae bacterium]